MGPNSTVPWTPVALSTARVVEVEAGGFVVLGRLVVVIEVTAVVSVTNVEVEGPPLLATVAAGRDPQAVAATTIAHSTIARIRCR
jgi:hypothetical protein